MALSSACAVCLLLPDKFEFERAISLQFADGSITAMLLFALMFATLMYVAARLWTWKRYTGAVLATVAIVMLAVIAGTNARSVVHNATFIGLTAFLVAGHIYAWCFSTDGRIFLTGLACIGGAILCPFNLGLAERIIICSTCLTLNILILEYLD
jgi:hypothetical protein